MARQLLNASDVLAFQCLCERLCATLPKLADTSKTLVSNLRCYGNIIESQVGAAVLMEATHAASRPLLSITRESRAPVCTLVEPVCVFNIHLTCRVAGKEHLRTRHASLARYLLIGTVRKYGTMRLRVHHAS